jgi:hypothetical protein
MPATRSRNEQEPEIRQRYGQRRCPRRKADAAVKKPVLNVGRLSDGRYKFGFSSQDGTIFCELSAPKPDTADDERSDDQKLLEAVSKLRRLVKGLLVILGPDPS